MLKIAVLAPMPRASVSTTIKVNPGEFRSTRNPYRTSCPIDLIATPRHTDSYFRYRIRTALAKRFMPPMSLDARWLRHAQSGTQAEFERIRDSRVAESDIGVLPL